MISNVSFFLLIFLFLLNVAVLAETSDWAMPKCFKTGVKISIASLLVVFVLVKSRSNLH